MISSYLSLHNSFLVLSKVPLAMPFFTQFHSLFHPFILNSDLYVYRKEHMYHICFINNRHILDYSVFHVPSTSFLLGWWILMVLEFNFLIIINSNLFAHLMKKTFLIYKSSIDHFHQDQLFWPDHIKNLNLNFYQTPFLN